MQAISCTCKCEICNKFYHLRLSGIRADNKPDTGPGFSCWDPPDPDPGSGSVAVPAVSLISVIKVMRSKIGKSIQDRMRNTCRVLHVPIHLIHFKMKQIM